WAAGRGGGKGRGQEGPAVLVGAVRDERRPDQVHADAVDDLGRARRRHLLLEDVVLDDGRAATTVLAWPVDAHPASCSEPALPVAQEGDLLAQRRELGRLAALPVGWNVRGEPGAQLGTKRLLDRREREVHARLLARARRSRSTSACGRPAVTLRQRRPPP